MTSQIRCDPFKISQQSMMLQNGWLREGDLLQNDPRFRFLWPWDTHSVKFQRGYNMNWWCKGYMMIYVRLTWRSPHVTTSDFSWFAVVMSHLYRNKAMNGDLSGLLTSFQVGWYLAQLCWDMLGYSKPKNRLWMGYNHNLSYNHRLNIEIHCVATTIIK